MKALERMELLEALGTALQRRFSTTDINSLLRTLGITGTLAETVSSKRIYAKEKLGALDDGTLVELAVELGVPVAEDSASDVGENMKDDRTVFVIHGRNEELRRELFSFLRAAGLDPLEWSEAVRLTGEGSPYVGKVLDHAFERAAAVIVLLTPDDEVRLSPTLLHDSDGAIEREVQLQPRPNVLFEAGMAFGRHPEQTILVSIGSPKPFSDVAGRHAVRLTDDVEMRLDLLSRLERAGCAVKTSQRRDWISTGSFRLEPVVPSTWEDKPPAGSEKVELDDLTENDMAVLAGVASHPGVTAKEMSEVFEASTVAVRHSLDRLVDAGLVAGERVPMGPTIWSLTKDGRAYAVEHNMV